jgi:hypothetical protein
MPGTTTRCREFGVIEAGDAPQLLDKPVVVAAGCHERAEVGVVAEQEQVGTLDGRRPAGGVGKGQGRHRIRPAAVLGVEAGVAVGQERRQRLAVAQRADSVVGQLVDALGGRVGAKPEGAVVAAYRAPLPWASTMR